MILIRVGDLKQFLYCRRIPYYFYCLPVARPVTDPMRAGTASHEVVSVLERRRSLRRYGLHEGKRAFHVPLESQTLGLTGVLDMLITVDGQGFPVEFKHTDQRLNLNAKYQLVAYAMLVEDCLGLRVEQGFLYRIPRRTLTPVAISAELRQRTRGLLEELRTLILREIIPPPPKQRGKCVECEFRRYCRDVL